MADLRGGTIIGGYPALHSGLKVTRVGGDLIVPGNAELLGDTSLKGKLTVSGDTSLKGKLTVSGATSLSSLSVNTITVSGATTFNNMATFSSGITSYQNLYVRMNAGGLTLQNNTNTMSQEVRINFTNSLNDQGVQIRFNHFDDVKPPFGLHIERSAGSGNAYLVVEGTLDQNYYSTGRLVAPVGTDKYATQ